MTDSALCCASTPEQLLMVFDEVDFEASTEASIHSGDYDTDTESSNEDQQPMYQHNESAWVPVCFVPLQWPHQSALAVQASFGEEFNEEWRTTVMLRNIPIEYTCEMLLKLFASKHLDGTYDFVYYPIDHRSTWGKGYAFINLISPTHAQYFMKSLEGFSEWVFPSRKACACAWSDPTQGLSANITRWQNSSIMHPSLPLEWKPRLFRHGMPEAFPAPTRPIKVPRF
jgi:hypothetical protein